jgi:hypothetical protein
MQQDSLDKGSAHHKVARPLSSAQISNHAQSAHQRPPVIRAVKTSDSKAGGLGEKCGTLEL